MAYRIFKFFFILLFVMPLKLYAQDAIPTSDTATVITPPPVQQVPAIVTKVNTIEKDYKWVSNTTKNIVLSSILLSPEQYQDYVISQYRTIFDRELTTRDEKYISRDIVIKALEEMVSDPEHLKQVFETLGITRNNSKNIHPRVESEIMVRDYYKSLSAESIQQQ